MPNLEWSNVVLVALLPFVSDYAERLGLTNSQPVDRSQVRYCLPERGGAVEGFIELTSRYRFWFRSGHVWLFVAPTSASYIQDASLITNFLGEVKLSKAEAVWAARETITRLGYSLESFYADLPPEVTVPGRVGERYVARYFIAWKAPNQNKETANIEIDAASGTPLKISLNSLDIDKPDPIVGIKAPPEMLARAIFSPPDQVTNNVILNRLRAHALLAASSAIRRIGLECGETSNATISAVNGRQEIRSKLTLKSGWRFYFVEDGATVTVSAILAPDSFFYPDHEVRIRDFLGERKISEAKARKIAAKALRQLSPDIKLFKAYEPVWPRLPPDVVVPRCKFSWQTDDGTVFAEIDLQSGAVKELVAY